MREGTLVEVAAGMLTGSRGRITYAFAGRPMVVVMFDNGLKQTYQTKYLQLVGDDEVENNNRVFKQLKDGITTKKGALWFENQDRFEIRSEDETEFNKDPNTSPVIRNKELITETKDFVEVFKVTPEYMTKEELEKFEEFKKSLKKKTVTKKKTTKKSKQ